MGSKGRMPPHMRRPPPPGMVRLDPFPPPHAGLLPFDVLPPPDVLEQKIASQSMEMDRLLTENRRLAATHVPLRQQLAAAQQDSQALQGQIEAIKSEREQQMRELEDKIFKMEGELKAGESIKTDIQKAHAEAQSLVASRQELISKAQQLDQDLQKAHLELPHIPRLMTELDALRQEYHHCRSTYEYEKKSYNDHLASLQMMEKNYVAMSQEVEKLRSELNSTSAVDVRTAYGGTSGYGESDPSAHHPIAANAYEDPYASAQARGSSSLVTSAAGVASAGGVPPAAYVPSQPGQAPARPGFDMMRGHTNYDPQRPPTYYDQHGMGHAYNAQRPMPGYDPQRGVNNYEMQRQHAFDHQGQRVQPPQPPQGQMLYSPTPPARPAAAGYEQAQNRGNPGR